MSINILRRLFVRLLARMPARLRWRALGALMVHTHGPPSALMREATITLRRAVRERQPPTGALGLTGPNPWAQYMDAMLRWLDLV